MTFVIKQNVSCYKRVGSWTYMRTWMLHLAWRHGTLRSTATHANDLNHGFDKPSCACRRARYRAYSECVSYLSPPACCSPDDAALELPVAAVPVSCFLFFSLGIIVRLTARMLLVSVIINGLPFDAFFPSAFRAARHRARALFLSGSSSPSAYSCASRAVKPSTSIGSSSPSAYSCASRAVKRSTSVIASICSSCCSGCCWLCLTSIVFTMSSDSSKSVFTLEAQLTGWCQIIPDLSQIGLHRIILWMIEINQFNTCNYIRIRSSANSGKILRWHEIR